MVCFSSFLWTYFLRNLFWGGSNKNNREARFRASVGFYFVRLFRPSPSLPVKRCEAKTAQNLFSEQRLSFKKELCSFFEGKFILLLPSPKICFGEGFWWVFPKKEVALKQVGESFVSVYLYIIVFFKKDFLFWFRW